MKPPSQATLTCHEESGDPQDTASRLESEFSKLESFQDEDNGIWYYRVPVGTNGEFALLPELPAKIFTALSLSTTIPVEYKNLQALVGIQPNVPYFSSLEFFIEVVNRETADRGCHVFLHKDLCYMMDNQTFKNEGWSRKIRRDWASQGEDEEDDEQVNKDPSTSENRPKPEPVPRLTDERLNALVHETGKFFTGNILATFPIEFEGCTYDLSSNEAAILYILIQEKRINVHDICKIFEMNNRIVKDSTIERYTGVLSYKLCDIQWRVFRFKNIFYLETFEEEIKFLETYCPGRLNQDLLQILTGKTNIKAPEIVEEKLTQTQTIVKEILKYYEFLLGSGNHGKATEFMLLEGLSRIDPSKFNTKNTEFDINIKNLLMTFEIEFDRLASIIRDEDYSNVDHIDALAIKKILYLANEIYREKEREIDQTRRFPNDWPRLRRNEKIFAYVLPELKKKIIDSLHSSSLIGRKISPLFAKTISA